MQTQNKRKVEDKTDHSPNSCEVPKIKTESKSREKKKRGKIPSKNS